MYCRGLQQWWDSEGIFVGGPPRNLGDSETLGVTGGCQGSIPEVAYDYVQLYGMTTEWVMPYTSHAVITALYEL